MEQQLSDLLQTKLFEEMKQMQKINEKTPRQTVPGREHKIESQKAKIAQILCVTWKLFEFM